MKLLHLFIAIALAFPSAMGLAAEESTSKAKKSASKSGEAGKSKPLPLRGTVVAITTRTLTLKGGEGKEDRKFTINKDTAIVKGEAAATTENVKVGQAITGSYVKNADGSSTLIKLQTAPKPSTAKKPEAKAADSKSKNSEGETTKKKTS